MTPPSPLRRKVGETLQIKRLFSSALALIVDNCVRYIYVFSTQIFTERFRLFVDPMIGCCPSTKNTLDVKVHCFEVGHVISLDLELPKIWQQALELLDSKKFMQKAIGLVGFSPNSAVGISSFVARTGAK